MSAPLHLLIIDDDDLDRERATRLLAKSTLPVQVKEAASGQQAMDLMSSQAYDCILLDNQLGDTTGSALMSHILKNSGQDCPIIMITGAGNEALAVSSLQDGAADYLSKVQLNASNLSRSIQRSIESHRLRRQIEGMQRLLEQRVEEQAETIRQRERDLQDILDHSPNIIGYWDNQERVRFGNKAHQHWLGVAADQLPGMKVREALGASMYALHEPYIAAAFNGDPQWFEHTIEGLPGTPTRAVQVEYRPDIGADGQVLGFYVTISDITALKAAQKNIEGLLAFVEAVISQSPVGMAVFQANGMCVMANPAMAAALHLPQHDVLASQLEQLPLTPVADLVEAARQTLHDGATRHIDSRLQIEHQPAYHLTWDLARVERVGQTHLLAMVRDVTEQEAIQDDLIQARNQAQEAARTKAAFLANMSHEIRTPMNAIIGLSRLALEDPSPSGARDRMARVHDSAIALMGILDDVLDYSKVEAGQMTLDPAPVPLEDLLQRLIDLFSGRVMQKGLRFDVRLQADLPTVIRTDALRLSQVLNNLVGNAVKFTQHGGITLVVERLANPEQPDQLRFAVTDTGIGVDPRHVHLFDAFAQADSSVTRRFGGSGLGLSICKRLIELMGGEIGYQRNQHQGSTFWVTVPLSAPELAPLPAPPMAGRRPQRLLLLATDPRRLDSQLAWLRQHTAIDCQALLDPAQLARQLAASAQAGAPPQVLLIDGSELKSPLKPLLLQARDFGLQALGQALPIVVLVDGHARQEAMEELGSARGVTLLCHPVLPQVLLRTLEQADGTVQGHADEDVAAPADKLRERGLALEGLHVLLVEDNVLNQMVAQAFLEQAGMQVTTAENGKVALELLANSPTGRYCAILMDMHMPVMDGLQATEHIKATPALEHIPIIAMTAAVMAEDRSRCQAVGMVDMVTKPIMAEALIDTLARWVLKRP